MEEKCIKDEKLSDDYEEAYISEEKRFLQAPIKVEFGIAKSETEKDANVGNSNPDCDFILPDDGYKFPNWEKNTSENRECRTGEIDCESTLNHLEYQQNSFPINSKQGTPSVFEAEYASEISVPTNSSKAETLTYRGRKKCCFTSCQNSRTQQVSLFRFPLLIRNNVLDLSTLERSKWWIKNSGNRGLLTVPLEELHKRFYVCSEHFKTGDMFRYACRTSRSHLCKHAIPSEKLGNVLSEEEMASYPAMPITDNDQFQAFSRQLLPGRCGLVTATISENAAARTSEVGSSRSALSFVKVNDRNCLSFKEERKCCFTSCRNVQGKSVTLFPFPNVSVGKSRDRSSDRCKLWIKNSGNESFLSVPLAELSRDYFVCSLHFKPEDFVDEKRTRLRTGFAVPTENIVYKLSEEVMSRYPPVQDFQFKMEQIFIKEEKLGDEEAAVEEERVFLNGPIKVEHFMAENDSKKTHVESSVQDSKYILPDTISSYPLKKEKTEKELQCETQEASSNDFKCVPCKKPAQSEQGIFGWSPSDDEDSNSFSSSSSDESDAGSASRKEPRTLSDTACDLNSRGSVCISGKSYECEHCSEIFTRKSLLKTHQRTQHADKKPFKCDVCDRRFTQKSHVNVHQRVHSGEKKFQCAECKQTFLHKSTLKNHVRIHSGERPFECEECSQKFSRKSLLRSHLFTHSGKKPFNCEHCDQKFSRKGQLNVHQRVHTGDKPYECDLCKEKFAYKSTFRNHRWLHSGERPFECGECKQRYTRKSLLNIHLRTHTGEKPFGCDECKRKFSQKSHLTIHQRIHTGEKPFECDECKQKFSQKIHLRNHLRVHTGEKPFVCGECQRNFSQKRQLLKHQRVHNGT